MKFEAQISVLLIKLTVPAARFGKTAAARLCFADTIQ
jgi:hypothetical protein